jgi:hypothetical protein
MRRPEAEDALLRALDVGHPRREGTIPALYALIEKSQLSFFFLIFRTSLSQKLWAAKSATSTIDLPPRLMPTTSKTKHDCCLGVMQRSP